VKSAQTDWSASGLKPLAIGAVDVGFPVVQAALSGYSDMAMRLVSRQMGSDYALCEVQIDRCVLEARKKGRRSFQIDASEHPVGGQLMGSDPLEFAQAAQRLVQQGFDIIDINFGCPVKKVLGRCRGGFHLSQPSVAIEIVQRVRDALPERIPLTVKMRRGIDDTQESRDHFFTILDGARNAGIAAATVHGRTVEQRYIGPSRWEFLRDVKRHVGPFTVLGSGDLFSAQDCLDMIHQTGIDGVTVARGSIGNPWIFQQARALAAGLPLPDAPGLAEQRRVIEMHYALADDLYGEQHCTRQMRKFGIKYARLHPRSEEVRKAFVCVRRPGEWRELLDRFYSQDLPGCYPVVDEVTPLECAPA
jgi:nifR3 family TIM-barrel protein